MTKILLVEDSKFLRLATERALIRAGYEVSTSADGKDALDVARAKMPDLILLDMLLPHMTGPDVLKALKKDDVMKGIPVVVLSGMSGKNAARLRADGAFGFLEKSVLSLDKGTADLLATVADIVDQIKAGAREYTPKIKQAAGAGS